MNFSNFAQQLKENFASMQDYHLVEMDVSKSDLWDTYLGSFPEGTNPIYITNTEHDCNCCKAFIRKVGNVCAIVDNKLVSIWDFDALDANYQVVADTMRELNVNADIKGVFRIASDEVSLVNNAEFMVGQKTTTTLDPNKEPEFNHFYAELSPYLVFSQDIYATHKGALNQQWQMCLSVLEQFSVDACETVLDLISNGSLYRGEEQKEKVSELLVYLNNFKNTGGSALLYAITNSTIQVANAKNSVIGVLIKNISEEMDLEEAVGKYEAMVAPANYKRSSAVVTKGMIDKAWQKVQELGLEDSLPRRQANLTDISTNNVLFTSTSARNVMETGAFGGLLSNEVSQSKPVPSGKIGLSHLIEQKLPEAKEVEVWFDKPNHLVTMTAPVHSNATPIFKWGNNLSWAYIGDVTDSITERVAKAGGKTDAPLGFSLAWSNSDDLDLSLMGLTKNTHIYFSNKRIEGKGLHLDVDMNVQGENSVDPVENIYCDDLNKLPDDDYVVRVTNYTKRNSSGKFQLQTTYLGQSAVIELDNPRDSASVTVVQFSVKNGVVTFKDLGMNTPKQEVWGMTTGTWQPVSVLCLSPNYWNDATGNKHYFFMLENAMNPEPVRGFYNEYLRPELYENRKVFEVLGSKMKAEPQEHQLSGLGFSSTCNAKLFVRITDNLNKKRTYEVLV